MKVCIYSDVHWSQNSSIIRSKGEKYSTRLENLIFSVNWVEQLAWEQNCDCVICCGDFFDSAILNAIEVSALQEIRWAPMSHLFLTGNHETNVSSLEYSTTDLFKLCPNVTVLNTPQQYFIDGTSVEFCFLPYVLERDRKSIKEYFGEQSCNRVIFSHNDLKNVQYGNFLSTEGFELSDIESNCNLYFNGHIHHCCNVTDKIINIGNLTGQNFTEDATKYAHCAIVLDTETLEYKYYQNNYAFKFYKLDCSKETTFEGIQHILNCLNYNAVATITVPEQFSTQTREQLEQMKLNHICEYRMLIERAESHEIASNIVSTSNDHLKQFEEYVLNEIGHTDIIRDELSHLMR